MYAGIYFVYALVTYVYTHSHGLIRNYALNEYDADPRFFMLKRWAKGASVWVLRGVCFGWIGELRRNPRVARITKPHVQTSSYTHKTPIPYMYQRTNMPSFISNYWRFFPHSGTLYWPGHSTASSCAAVAPRCVHFAVASDRACHSCHNPVPTSHQPPNPTRCWSGRCGGASGGPSSYSSSR